jgi:hypothetical protein
VGIHCKKTQANIGENLKIRSIYAVQQYKNLEKEEIKMHISASASLLLS